MQDRPTARELVEAAASFIEREIVPTVNDPRLRFRALVAANVLAIVSRELAEGDVALRAEWERLVTLLGADAPGEDLREEVDTMERALCAEIRSGRAELGGFRNEVLAHVEQTVKEKLQIANPRYLERAI